MTPPHRTETVLTEDGKLSLDHLPFRAGQAVEVIILSAPMPVEANQSLRGSVLKYDGLTEPVAVDDWEAIP